MIKAIITDIEGTTTSISFVFDVLFPYARENINLFIHQNSTDKAVRDCLDEIIDISGVENNLDAIALQLEQWIDDDQKITALKTLQGMIWKRAYEAGDFTGHIYDDVEPVLKQWYTDGIKLYVYSSGSVAAQKLLFGYSDAGDLTPMFTDYFDTHIGTKRDQESYQNILNQIALPAEQVLFLSDIEEELDAASKVGIKTIQLVREGTTASKKHTAVLNFSVINLSKFS